MNPFVKICGITRVEDIEICQEDEIDALGFVLVPTSSRYVHLSQLEALSKAVIAPCLKVGVTANQDLNFLREAVDAGKLDVLQLHGNESPEFARQIDFCDVWKAGPLLTEDDADRFQNFPARLLIADSAQGGSGRPCDWDLAAKLARKRPILIAGGITVDNVLDALKKTDAFGIDLSGGVEIRPGIKSPDMIKDLIHRIRISKKVRGQRFTDNVKIKNENR